MVAAPWLQKTNARLHQEPLSSLAYALFWIFVLVWSVPIAVAVLFVRLLYQSFGYWFTGAAEEYDPKNAKHQGSELALVITGCDSGFGKEIAVLAAEAGFVVFAGFLNREESLEQFRLLPNVISLQMDVTKDEEVANAVTTVQAWIDDEKKKRRVLHALICNAGVGNGFFVDLTDLSIFQEVMNVNFYGTIRCCKAFLPIFKSQAIQQTHDGARIFNLTSLAGLNPGPPGASAYAASKHAAQTFSQCLRGELAVFNVQVCSINPTFHQTQIVSSLVDRLINFTNALPEEKRKQYGEDFFAHVKRGMESFVPPVTWNLQVVADQTIKLLKTRRPPPENVIGMDGRFLFVFARILPAWFLDWLSTLAPPPPIAVLKRNKNGTDAM
jgi:NAD(P)-dependent dehydrogenase (short-subunit alcohol dehydrogenase family)